MLREPLLRIDDLRVSLEGRDVIRRFELQIDPGERVCLVGPAGSGKSLLLELLAGRFVPHQGHLSYPAWIEYNPDAGLGVPPRFSVQLVSTNEQRRLVSRYASFHQARWHSSFSEPCTVESFLSPRSTYGLRDFEACPAGLELEHVEKQRAELLTALGIEYLLPRQLVALSNGEWRKLLLTRALLAQPRLLLLDDPLAGLDPESRKRVLDVLVDFCRAEHGFAPCSRVSADAASSPRTANALPSRGVLTLVCTTPRPNELSSLATRMVVLDGPHASVPDRPRKSDQRTVAHEVVVTPRDPPSLVLCLRGATVRSGSTTLLDNVSLEVTSDQHWLITGPNGAGKSTLLALLLGDHPQSYVVDLEVLGLRAKPGVSLFERQRRIGYMASELTLHYPGSWSLRDVVLSGINASIGHFVTPTLADEAHADAWLERFDLLPKSRHPLASTCEVELRKVFLARALVRQPALLMLDEPTQGLTGAESQVILDVLDAVVERANTTLLIVSHHARERPRCITHHLALDHGRIVHCGKIGTPEQDG
jgi:molybdate transport system ATP-binding protein